MDFSSIHHYYNAILVDWKIPRIVSVQYDIHTNYIQIHACNFDLPSIIPPNDIKLNPCFVVWECIPFAIEMVAVSIGCHLIYNVMLIVLSTYTTYEGNLCCYLLWSRISWMQWVRYISQFICRQIQPTPTAPLKDALYDTLFLDQIFIKSIPHL